MISSTQKSHILTAIGAAVLSAAITTQASLIQWLTVTNVSTLETDDTGRVINWLDSSGSGNDTINAGGIIGTPLYPSDSLAASGIPGVDLGTNRNGFRLWTTTAQDTWLDFTGAASGKSGFAVLVAFKIDANASSSSRNTVIASHGNPAANPSFVLKYETGYPACYLGSGANNTQYINTSPSAALQAGDTVVFAFNYSAATGFWELWDSKSGGRMTSTAAANGNFSSAQTMYLGTSENDGQWFSGNVFEVKIYDNVLTATELTDAFQAMRTQWAPPPATVSTNAVLIQHLDATASGSVSNVSGQVVTWLDQTTNANNGTPITGTGVGIPLYPSASLSGSGKAGVDLGINSWPSATYPTNRSGMDLFPAAKQPGFLDFTGAAQTNGGFSVLVVFKADSVVSTAINANSRNPVLVNHGNSATTNTFGLRFDATGTMETFLGGTVYQKTGGLKVSAGDTIVYAFSYDALTGAIQFWDSKNNSSLLATSRPFGNFASPQSMKLGTSDNNQQQFNGMIGEVKIFAGKLGSATLITEAQALTTKWGATNPSLDGDGDGLSDADEVNLYHTNPLLPDTDGDGAGDWYEVIASFTNPTNPASKPNIPYPLPKPDNSTGATNKPVKVFILSGQSNMVGMGDVSPLGTAGTLSTLVKQQGKFSHLLDSGGNWSVRNDVWYRGVIAATGNTNLLVGQASSSTAIGPELAFGHVMGYYLNEPVLVLKSSQGGRSLGWDFLPPGSQRYTNGTTVYAGYGDSAATWAVGAAPPGPPSPNASYGGWQYDQCFLTETNWAYPGNSSSVTNVTDVLDHWATQYPQWAAQGFEIAGFVWFQGWNDGLSYTTPYADRYETNLVELIKHLRSYYGNRYPGKIKTNAPFVVATSGFNGWSASGNRLQVANAQLAVSNTNKYPGFADNVKTMETRGYWRDAAVSPNSKQDYHYWRNAETFLLVGDALGRGMIDLLGAGTVSDYASWATSFPGANLSDPNADFDGDTLSNDYERIWGLNPTNALSRNPFASISSLQSGSFTYTRRTPSLTLLNYTVWTSTNLLAWTQDLGAGQTPGAPLNQVETVTVNLSPALRTNPSFFVRLRANQQAP